MYTCTYIFLLHVGVLNYISTVGLHGEKVVKKKKFLAIAFLPFVQNTVHSFNSKKKLAKYCCHRYRNYLKNDNYETTILYLPVIQVQPLSRCRRAVVNPVIPGIRFSGFASCYLDDLGIRKLLSNLVPCFFSCLFLLFRFHRNSFSPSNLNTFLFISSVFVVVVVVISLFPIAVLVRRTMCY